MKKKIRAVAAVLCLLLCLSVMLSSCEIDLSSMSARSVVGASVNGDGELILVYSDGEEQSLGVVVGRDGADGRDGQDGRDGIDGRDGRDGQDGTVTVLGDGGEISLACARGLQSAVSIVCRFTATVQQGGWYPGGGGSTTKEYSSAGSGVIYRLDKTEGDALIITNYHVVYDASANTENGISEDIRLYLYGGEYEEAAVEATYVGGSMYYDIAVLSVEDSEILASSDAIAVTCADPDSVSVGDSAIAIGNPQGYGISVSCGVVSVDSEYITMAAADGKTEVSFRVMRVDTAVNSGNSGGGLYDAYGRLIGIVNAKIVDDGVESIGYAIPVGTAVPVAENIIDYCYGGEGESVQRALLGITLSTSDSRAVYDAGTGKVRISEEVSVYEVGEGSIAEGILFAGDVLLEATLGGDTVAVTRQYHIIDLMLDARAGDELCLRILRGGTEMTVSIVVTEECLTAY